MVDFVTEGTNLEDPSYSLGSEDAKKEEEDTLTWRLYVDGTPDNHLIHFTLRFGFMTSNNEAEYEALLAGLRLARDMHAHSLEIFSDSQLVVYQILGEYRAKGMRMA